MKETYIDSETFDKNKTYYYVNTNACTFRANDLTEVLELWHDGYEGNNNDEYFKALQVGRCG